MATIGILYIGVGRYACFWPDFYKSCEEKLLAEVEKHYYVFTDHEELIVADKRVTVLHQDDMGWPCNSLFRFKMFNRISGQLAVHDYLFFFNSNALIVQPVAAADILPGDDEDFSAMCMASGDDVAHEQRPVSAAYVPRGTTNYYFSGALNGGKCRPFLELIAGCDQLVDTDLRNGIMPVWHDESVINRYLVGKSVKLMYRDMGRPANWKEPQHPKIILRRKEDVLGRGWLRSYKGREHTNTWFRKLLRKIGIVK